MRYLLLSLLLTCSACTLLESESVEASLASGAGAEQIVLVNTTAEPIHYTAFELEASNAIDPRPTFVPSEVPLPRLDAGGSAVVPEIGRYEPGKGVRFFIYALRDVDGEARVSLVRFIDATARDLQRTGGRVVVDKL